MKILISPCHYILSENMGSEFSWSYFIYKGISSKLYKDSIFITGASDINKSNIKNLNLFSSKKINLNILNVILFHLLTQLYSLRYLNECKILFHMLPFKIRSSVNFLFFIPYKFKRIIGPVQLPLSVSDNDLDISDIRGNNKKKNTFNFNFILCLIKPILSYLNLKMLKKAHKIIAISEDVKDELVKQGVSYEKIEVIPVGVDSIKFKKIDGASKNKTFTLISTSLLLKRKNVDQIIKAVGILKSKNCNIKLIVVGDGPQKHYLINLVNDLGLKSEVEFLGFVENRDIVEYYNNADCFVSMSSSESWGQVYLEAMSCGLPVITSINEGSKVIIKENESGFLVPQGDVEYLSKKIRELISDKEKREFLSKNSRKIIEECYDWDKCIIPKYLRIFNDLLRTDLEINKI